MTTTILAAFALTGALSPIAAPAPSVQTDYARALKVAATEQKPMAVLIGKGDAFAKLMSDASLTPDAKKAIGEKFVCVSVDVNTAAGKELAEQFQMKSGLVISTTGGTYQSVRQVGEVSAVDFAKYTGTVTSTPTVACANGTCPLVSTGATATCASGNCPLSGGSASSCASGNCGTATVSGCASGTCGATGTPSRGGIFRRR